jgi:hypothetical protein
MGFFIRFEDHFFGSATGETAGRLLASQVCRFLERFQPACAVDPGRFARGTALRLLAMARHVASPRLVPQANRLGLASHSQAESALVRRRDRAPEQKKGAPRSAFSVPRKPY